MTVENKFTKYAKDYDDHNIIQRIISKALAREITDEPKNILELGCGSGQIFREINWEFDNYLAVDFSSKMCELHPKKENLKVKCFDFDSHEFREEICKKSFDLIISSSALQWSKNLPGLLEYIVPKTKKFQAVLFTSNTFKEIYKITRKEKSILSLDEIKDAFSIYKPSFEVLNYNLYFENKKELFDYIKNSGVGGENKLNFKEARNLYKNYSLNYLEFEVIFVKF
ncbi:MAG: methyltransferase [Arcobacteraceae bacterium]|jgi:malonyl-CoA O-methyltransferase